MSSEVAALCAAGHFVLIVSSSFILYGPALLPTMHRRPPVAIVRSLVSNVVNEANMLLAVLFALCTRHRHTKQPDRLPPLAHKSLPHATQAEIVKPRPS
ncbi:unnamed protein product [Vitrella brassicaformis CCMP3155]|uniref:Uncharacterized protein n=1 Tax=Vitrella brassicaformis (strain CCMP3155) TaxID=1169540 RepID=A0A0G4EKE8_VITBC|nr:unnamed protein product [Vitrella brassicaformis CCMP3155]|eukprot:CEL97920.1 unnamed protein product [Vitrella brassicaformis CCMP3155]